MPRTLVQPALAGMFPTGLAERLPHKPARQTSREVYRFQRERDKRRAAAGKETGEGRVLRVLAWHWNRTQRSPTAYELLAWGQAHGEPFFDINSVRPALTRLLRRGLVEIRGKRRCSVRRQVASTWAVREAGSQGNR
jgi:hypothetical protein